VKTVTLVRALVLCALSFLVFIASIDSPVKAQAPPPATQARPASQADAAQTQAQSDAAERGRKQFQETCAACHAADATGGRGPDLIRSSLVRRDKNGELIGVVVTQGRPDRGMPAFSLSDAQISDIAAFLHGQVALFDLHTRMPGGYPNDIPADRLATGTVEAGKAFFNGAGGCSGCHSPTGDLAGIATKYDPQDLQSRFLYPSGGAGATITAAVTLKDGQHFSGKLFINDDDFVSIQDDKDGWYHCWSRADVKSVDIHDPLAAHRELLLHKITDADMHNLFTYLETLK
jgi:cytochrome c oxidase cbb3-type subunit III